MADEGAGRHPIVEAALAGRTGPSDRPAAHSAEEGPVGWPGDEHENTGLGWPLPAGSPDGPEPAPDAGTPAPGGPTSVTDQQVVVNGPDAVSVVPARRRGWRRLFGRPAAATDAAAGTGVPAG